MNKFEVIGRLTKDPDIRSTSGSNPVTVAKFNVAVRRRYKKKDETDPPTDFIPIVCYGKTAEISERFLHKGDRVAIVGWLQTYNYKNKEDKTVFAMDVVCEEIEFLETKKLSDNEKTEEDEDGFMTPPDESALPFR